MTVSIPPDKSMTIPSYPIWRLSVEQYHDMIRAGILTEDDLVELLEGWLVTKMPKSSQHSLSTRLIRKAFDQLVPAGWFVDSQEPITTDDSEPELDVLVIRESEHNYLERHPFPSEVALIVEVSDSTLQRDRTLKLRLYAHARIPVYWILNLQAQQLEVYSEPIGEGETAIYQQQHEYQLGDDAPVVIDGQELGRVRVGALME